MTGSGDATRRGEEIGGECCVATPETLRTFEKKYKNPNLTNVFPLMHTTEGRTQEDKRRCERLRGRVEGVSPIILKYSAHSEAHNSTTRFLHSPASTVDDGTGCLECIVWHNSDGGGGGGSGCALSGLRLGALVRLQGRITAYREQVQLTVRTWQACGDANTEVLFWMDWARCGGEIEERRARGPGGSAGSAGTAGADTGAGMGSGPLG